MESLDYSQAMTLYHRLADPDCAEVRRKILALGLAEKVNFRNVDMSANGLAALQGLLGQDRVPTLETQGKIYVGKAAILQFLEQSGIK